MWIKSMNGESIAPKQKEITGNHVILRKNIKLIEAAEELPNHYEWDEWQMTAEQYAVYQNFETRMAEQDDALIELAGLISEVV